MANIVSSSIIGSGTKVITVTTLGASDTLIFKESTNPILILKNGTAGVLTPLIDGDGATTFPAAGIGDVDVSAGLTLSSIAIGATVAIPLKSIRAYLKGIITVTGADGIEAQLLEF